MLDHLVDIFFSEKYIDPDSRHVSEHFVMGGAFPGEETDARVVDHLSRRGADALIDGQIQLVINTPRGKASKADDAYIRKTAIRCKLKKRCYNAVGTKSRLLNLIIISI